MRSLLQLEEKDMIRRQTRMTPCNKPITMSEQNDTGDIQWEK